MFRNPFLPDPCKKIPKKIAKKFKKLKNFILALFLSKPRLDRPRKKKKIFVSNSKPTRQGLENSKKIAKKFEKLKNFILAFYF